MPPAPPIAGGDRTRDDKARASDVLPLNERKVRRIEKMNAPQQKRQYQGIAEGGTINKKGLVHKSLGWSRHGEIMGRADIVIPQTRSTGGGMVSSNVLSREAKGG